MTSSYPSVGAVGPGPSVDYMMPSLSTNPFVDVGYCFGLPTPPTGTPVPDATRMTSSLSTFNPGLPSVTVGLSSSTLAYPTSGLFTVASYSVTLSTAVNSRDVFVHPSSLSTGAAAAVTSSPTAATTSGLTSRPSDQFVVGAQAFDGPLTSLVHAAVVSTSSSATVPLVPDPSMLNFVVQGTDAARGRPMFPVGATSMSSVVVPGVPTGTSTSLTIVTITSPRSTRGLRLTNSSNI